LRDVTSGESEVSSKRRSGGSKGTISSSNPKRSILVLPSRTLKLKWLMPNYGAKYENKQEEKKNN
jgi:hypothetical protein